MKKSFLLFVLFTFTSISVSALSLKEKKRLKSWIDSMSGNEPPAWVKKHCKKDISFKIDEAMVKPFIEANIHGGGTCSELASHLDTLCRYDKDNLVKPAVKEKLDSVLCTVNKDPSKLEFKFKEKVIVASIGTKSVNVGENFRKWLENNL